MGTSVSGFNNNVLSAENVLKVFQGSGLDKMTRNDVLERIPAAVEQANRFGRRAEILNKISASLNYLAEKKGLLVRAGNDEEGRQFWALKERMEQARAEEAHVGAAESIQESRELEEIGAVEDASGSVVMPLELKADLDRIPRKLSRYIAPVDDFHMKLQVLAILSQEIGGPTGEVLESIAGDLIDFQNQSDGMAVGG
jgi:hypothetical protein